MDLSGVIFVAVAVAWAAYLIPQALKHHDEAVESRSVERFSATLRVLARRGAVEAPPVTAVPVAAPTPAQLRARRAAARRAMQRRRRVLGVLVGLLVIGVLLAAFGVVAWGYVSAPVALLVAWLVTCRVMVKGERAAFDHARRPAPEPAQRGPVVLDAASREEDLVAQLEEYDDGEVAELLDASADTQLISAVSRELGDEPAAVQDDRDPATLWTPVAAPLPTYVGKDHAAARELPAFDLDDSGIFSSGHDRADSELVRRTAVEADEQRAADAARAAERRVVGH
ncbi:hypothetical protein INN71_13030 [Nocardioides sp. ChNu-153]|uniref:divisome protein SepX/GlpR n=1 Tax=unclassified Nocardioides TaxID=2615069 RepID=UPI002406F8B5|nr:MULTISPECIES: hypothetical protein [unclassified Nocardioides]MDF9715044.1 hypothetical protein [Nocardioides sp. ChNu-99]MDN7122313.1 hypothetical protein [Nocardioides sp. ChNu-153]